MDASATRVSTTGRELGLNFDEGESCYKYKGYIFAQKMNVIVAFQESYKKVYELHGGEVVKEGYTGLYKKLVCRKKCCD